MACWCNEENKEVVIKMVKVRIDMTGWVMKEHGVPDSKITVLMQVEDYVDQKGNHAAKWLCQCDCGSEPFIVTGSSLRSGHCLSCGCLRKNFCSNSFVKTNTVDLSGDYGIGWTTNTNREFYFDLEDYDKIKDCCWCENVDGNGYHYLSGWDRINRKTIRITHLLGYGEYDHKNRNPFDNRKKNFRKSTIAENNQNRSRAKNNTSGVTGVYWSKQANKWCAFITENKHRIHLGCFANKNDAIYARLSGEKEYFKEFAPQQHLFEKYGINT